MTAVHAALGLILFNSISFNVYLLIQLKKKRAKPQSIELREFLADLLSGPAMLAIARVDTSNVLLRSPKSK